MSYPDPAGIPVTITSDQARAAMVETLRRLATLVEHGAYRHASGGLVIQDSSLGDRVTIAGDLELRLDRAALARMPPGALDQAGR